MSKATQQITASRAGMAAYSPAATFAAASAESVLVEFGIDSVDYSGVSVGFGLSDLAAWDGVIFRLYENGAQVLKVTDQIGDLLRKEFLPMSFKNNAALKVTVENASAVPSDVALFLRFEV